MLAAALLVLGIALGALITMATYATELRRIARFLQTREPRSNARATTAVGVPGIRDLADAVNTELDRSSRERVDAQRHQDEFQRDLSALSHDIRTPLTGAKGYLQLAYDETDASTRQLHLAAATSRIDSTTALLDELFAYTKSTDPDLTLNMQPVALRPLIERVLVGHYPEFEKRGWEPELCMPDEAPGRDLVVLADPDALARILENLVTNAVRHGYATGPERDRRHGREPGSEHGQHRYCAALRPLLPGRLRPSRRRKRPWARRLGQPCPCHGHGAHCAPERCRAAFAVHHPHLPQVASALHIFRPRRSQSVHTSLSGM